MSRALGFPVEPAWALVLTDLGVRPSNVLRRAELPEDLFSRAGARLSTSQYFAFWHALTVEVDDPVFPLRFAEAVRSESFSPPLFAALCSPDLLTACRRISHYKRLVAPMKLEVSFHDRLDIDFEWLEANVQPPPTLVACEFVFFVRLAQMATRHPVRPAAVRSTVDLGPLRAYEDFFGVRIEPARTSGLSFSREDAQRPFMTANPAVWSAFEPMLQSNLEDLDESATTADRVRATLLDGLPSGRSSMDTVARRLAMSRRTLQRRLRTEGTSFQRILRLTREQLARHYLGNTQLPASEISFLLGFEEPNSFYRALNDWTGQTPEGMRRALAESNLQS